MQKSWRISPDISFVDTDVHIVALNLARLDENRLPRAVDGPGATIWRLIEEFQDEPGGCTTDGLVDALTEIFDADRDRIKSDTETFLAQLQEEGLIINPSS
ncbi:PqqD family protein [Microbacteriaceae bacterium VKM Ac-2855]|nr:PqqD family protein [Microbacteriaceae bacterium VKM Ac-2855]